MTQIPIEPYWVNAANWFIDKYGIDQLKFLCWLADQGVVGFPVSEYRDYLEFVDASQALMFRLKWA